MLLRLRVILFKRLKLKTAINHNFKIWPNRRIYKVNHTIYSKDCHVLGHVVILDRVQSNMSCPACPTLARVSDDALPAQQRLYVGHILPITENNVWLLEQNVRTAIDSTASDYYCFKIWHRYTQCTP